MKIIKRVRDIHEESRVRFEKLASEVRDVLKPQVEARGWFFISRIKALESFALKIETGRVSDPKGMEDFFGCTIVVATSAQLEEAENLILSLYDHFARRPSVDTETHKESSSFAFDDLRLYVKRRSQASGKYPELDGVIFEIQVKTILQHAWAVATHDLIYKSDTISWPRERIAFQVKAMLEHAEVAIAEANRLADTPAVAKKDRKTSGILELINHLNSIWSKDRLPSDIKRLAQSIFDILKICEFGTDKFVSLIDDEKRRLGLLPAHLSPYALTVQALANSREVDLEKKLNRTHIRTRMVLHRDMDLPAWMLKDNVKLIMID